MTFQKTKSPLQNHVKITRVLQVCHLISPKCEMNELGQREMTKDVLQQKRNEEKQQGKKATTKERMEIKGEKY